MADLKKKNEKISVEVNRDTLLAFFPSQKSLQDFKEVENAPKAIVDKLIAAAYEQHLLSEKSEQALQEFIETASGEPRKSPLEGLAFTQLIAKVTGAKSESLLAEELVQIAQTFDLHSVSKGKLSVRITRLKQNFQCTTPIQRITLRLLAYWIALNHPELHWDFNKFFTLPTGQPERSIDPHNGVEIVLKIQPRGDTTVESSAIKWVEKELRDCIQKQQQRITELHLPTDHLHAGQIHLSAVSVSLKLFRFSQENIGYTPSIRDGFAIAHQMAVRWLLAKEEINDQKALMIALYAGDLSQSSLFLNPILRFHEQINEPSLILVNEWAHQLAQVANLKIAFELPESSIDLGREGILRPWIVSYFWHHPYFDFIPKLEKDLLPDKKILFSNKEEQPSDRKEQFLNDESQKYIMEQYRKNIRPFIQRFPHNSLLLMEVVKVLLARRQFPLADEFLSNILELSPHHVLARISRMFLYENLAAMLQEESDFTGSEFAFERALAESKFFLDDCMEPEGVTAVGTVYYARASSYFKFIRTQTENLKELRKKMLFCLEQAGKQFLRAVSLASDGKDIRALALYAETQVLLEQVRRVKQPEHLLDHSFLNDDRNLFYTIAISLFKLVGLLSVKFPGNVSVKTFKVKEGESSESIEIKKKHIEAYMEFIKCILAMNTHFQQSVLSRTFTPNTRYFWGCFLWDFMPVLTKSLCHIIRESFKEALSMAKDLQKDGFFIYNVASVYSQDTSKFIEVVNKSIKLIENIISDEEFQEGKEYWEALQNRKDGEPKKGFYQDLLAEDTMRKVSKEKLILQFSFYKQR